MASTGTSGGSTAATPAAGVAGGASTEVSGVRIGVDRSLPTPAYMQLRDQIVKAIDDGSLTPGTGLPSERAMAADLRLARMTVRRAFEELVNAGVVEQRRGSGTFVKPRPLEQVIDRVLGFTEEARSLGFSPGSSLLAAEVVPADDDVAAALGASPGSPTLRVTRLRTAGAEPLALQDAYLREDLASLSLDLLAETGSLYLSLARQFDVRPVRARQTIAARMPSETEARVLGIGRGVPVLALERTTSGVDGRPFEYVRSAYRGDLYRMALDLRSA